jgi:hypothetical protein
MIKTTFALIGLLLFPLLARGGEKEEVYLREKMIPLAQEFIKKVGLPCDFQIGTNQVMKYDVDYFRSRPGCLADMRLTNNYAFHFYTEKGKTEVRDFRQILIKTYYALDDAPKEKIEAVKALNLKNKLNDKTALKLAKKYFKLLGHKEEDFRPPECRQCYWIGKNDVWGNLPYYDVIWYRKDVNMADVRSGVATIPQVTMTVSGIDSNLVSYSKLFMPVGSDF